MNITSLKQSFNKLLNGKRKTGLIVAIGMIGILFIFLSELIPSGQSSPDAASSTSENDIYTFKENTEKELEKMLSDIKGVGDVSVMISVSGTVEYVYAEEVNMTDDANGDNKTQRSENKIVIIEENGEKKALVKKMLLPSIGGVVVVCEGGGNTSVNERVIKAVSAALNVPTNKICVECKKLK